MDNHTIDERSKAQARLTFLRLCLKELDISISLDIFECPDRVSTQSAVYLGQACGADFGYRYGWYLNMPYSIDLGRDCFALADEECDLSQSLPFDLRSDIKKQLRRAKGLFVVPHGVKLSKHGWLELLVSTHYANHVLLKSTEKSKEFVLKARPKLAKYIDQAINVLEEQGLVRGV